MNLTIENILLIGSVLLFISIVASKTSFRIGVPILIFFIGVGMLAGSEGVGGIYFDDPQLTQFIGIVALNFILFSGGFETTWHSIKPVLWQGISLSTLGVLITTASVGTFVWWATDFSIYEGLLLGAIVSSTDAAAVFSILRSKNLGLKNNIRPLLELESGSNDPIAYLLTIVLTGIVTAKHTGTGSLFILFIQEISFGVVIGYGLGKLSRYVINNIKLNFEGLYPVLVIALMFFTFSITNFVHGNGFLAVYLSAVYLGNQELIHKRTIIKVFDGLAWLMQIILFLTLGLLVFPSQIVPILGLGVMVSLFLIFVARPLSVFLSLSFFKMKTRSKLFVSWVGLRGAVPIVFATYPLIAGVDKAGMIFNVVFFISLTSVLIQGTTLGIIAKWLRVDLPEKVKPKNLTDLHLTDGESSEYVEIILPPHSKAAGKQIVDLRFPKTALIATIHRNGKYITPKGATVLEPGDKLFILAENSRALNAVHSLFELNY